MYLGVGLWSPTEGLGAWIETVEAFGHVRAAGTDGELQPADQHIHKVDPYAGGTREDTLQLYIEAGMDAETAAAAVLGAELEAESFHLGADNARVAVSCHPDGCAAWAICADLEPGYPPRVQATLLLVAPEGSLLADGLRGWSPSSEDAANTATGRAELLAHLNTIGLAPMMLKYLHKALNNDDVTTSM